MDLPEHPYFPLGTAMPDYLANHLSGPELVAYFAAGSGAILGTALLIIQGTRPGLRTCEIATALWFVLCGFIHFFFEGEHP